MLSTPKSRGELFLASSLRDGLEDNDLRQVETLLTRNDADPNVLLPNHGITPFHLVIGNESEEFAEQVTKLFLRHGGDPNVRSADGMTPVHVAAAWGRVKVLELLLANGGDPLYLDDDARSPFHYAFEGAFYDAVAILGKYCTIRDDEKEEENEPKYKLTLDKILINKGNVVAEYVPSNLKLCASKAAKIAEIPRKLEKNENSVEISENSNSDWPSSENVTLRRYQRDRRDDKKNREKVEIGIGEGSAEEERLLIGRIIRRLSNSIASDSSSVIGKNEAIIPKTTKTKTPNDEKSRNFTKLPRYQNYNSTKATTPRRLLVADNSIISKSPNCRISTKKDEGKKNLRNENTPPLRKTPEVRIRSASSTPKIKRYSRLYESAKLSQNKKNNFLSAKRINGTRRIFGKNSDKDENLAPREITRNPEKKKYFIDPKNIGDFSKPRDKRPEISSPLRGNHRQGLLRPVRIYNDIKPEVGTETPKRKILTGKIIEPDNFNFEKFEDEIPTIESPGSSNPVSACRLENSGSYIKKENLIFEDDPEDTKILLEIEEACKNRCTTPPASISILEDEDEAAFHSDYSSGDPGSISDFYDANSKTAASWSRSESFVSLDEEYTYEDEEEGIAFIERHLCVLSANLQDDMNRAKEEESWIDRLGEMSVTSDPASPSPRSLARSAMDLNSRMLRERLTALGEIPGPITETTFNVYLKRLWKLERNEKKSDARKVATKEDERIGTVGKEIPDFLFSTDWTTKERYYRDLEMEAFREYAMPNPRRKYRGGTSKNSFCYLLLDPRITRDLPRCGLQLSLADRWRTFLDGIFYVGQGKASRPAAHLYDAYGVWSKMGGSVGDAGRKIRRILDIWKNQHGVVCLRVFSHTMMEEACSREAAIIEAIGTSHLTNCQQGTYYGYATTMSSQEKRSLGKYLLYKSMEIFMHEGERQLFPRNVIS